MQQKEIIILDINNEKHNIKILSKAIRFKDKLLNVYVEICGDTYKNIIQQIKKENYLESYNDFHENGYMLILDNSNSPIFLKEDYLKDLTYDLD